jgi:hypothetical protein
MEYWSVGVMKIARIEISTDYFSQHSINPIGKIIILENFK